MHEQDAGSGPSRRRPRWMVRAVALLVLATTAAGGVAPAQPPFRELLLASATNPAPPTGVTVTGGDRTLTVSWTAPGEAFITRYDVFLDGGPVAVTSSTTTAATISGLVNGREYLVTVKTVTNVLGVEYVGSTASSPPAPGTPRDSVAPAAPTGVAAARGDGRVTVSWTANGTDTDADGYRVLRDGVDVSGLLLGGTTVTWTDTTVVNDTTYGYTVQTHDTSGNWSASSAPVASATPTDLTAPATPTGLVGGRGDERVGLSWDPNPEADVASYRVLRDGVEIATVAGTTHLDLGLTNDTTYSYTLVAVDTHGNRSAPSAAVAVTPTDLTPPGAPTGLAAVRGDGRVDLSWDPNPEPDVASYRVLRNGVEIATVTGATAFVDLGLTNDTTYDYTLAAVDTHGNRSVSSSPAVSATPTDLGAPAVPTGLSAVRGDGQVSLSWTANTEPDLANYRLIRDGLEIATVTGATGYLDTGLANDVTYSYRLAALDTHGNRSADSAPVTATPTDLTAPAAPTGLGAVKGSGQVTLSWAANAEPDLATYRVLRDGVEIATVTGTTYTDTSANGVNRTYTVVAVDTHGNRSAPSAPVTSSADATPPAPPTGLTATRGDGQVSLVWAANSEPDLASYRVLRDGVEIATVTARTYTDTGRTNDVTYTYTLVAVDASGNRSAASAPASATPTDLTPPAAPTGLVATAGENRVALSWAANAEPDLASYRVLRDGVEVATVTGTAHTDTGLTNDVAYSYSLVAVDTHGNRSPASTAATATPRDGPPTAPTGVTAASGDRRAVIGWTAPPDPDVVSHRVLAEDGSTVATASAPATQAVVSGLTNGTTYRYTVVAVDAAGHVSAPSATVTVVPVSPAVPTTGAGESGGVAVSGDGRFVVVGTRAQREPSDTNTAYELYLVDRTAGTARRIAPLPASATGAADPTNLSAPAISDDGRYVVLATTAALLPADTNGLADVYRLDTSTGTWALVSAPPAGTVHGSTAGAVLQPAPSVYATSPPMAVSADGDLVLFYSARADLVAGDTNGVVDLFAKRLTTGAVTRVSTTTAGGNLPGAALGPALALTPDGRFALFPAASGTGAALLYRKTLSGAGAGQLLLVSSVVRSGITTEFAVYRDAGDIALSDDGAYAAFVTANRITSATPGAVNGTGLAYRKDLTTGGLVAMGSGQQAEWEHRVELDPTGRYGFFATTAAALPADGNGHTDFYRRDLDGGVAGPLVMVTTDSDGRVVGGPIGAVASTEYGRVFAADANRVLLLTSQALASADTNRLRDLYVKDLGSGIAGSPLG